MLIIYTYTDDKGCLRVDYGYDTENMKMCIMPPEKVNDLPLNVIYDNKIGELVWLDEDDDAFKKIYVPYN